MKWVKVWGKKVHFKSLDDKIVNLWKLLAGGGGRGGGSCQKCNLASNLMSLWQIIVVRDENLFHSFTIEYLSA
jgi:hypothetical protein